MFKVQFHESCHVLLLRFLCVSEFFDLVFQPKMERREMTYFLPRSI